jgi:predicted ATPase
MTPEGNQKLTRVQIEGYRSLKSVELTPGDVTVMIGANGSGKSNLLSLLRMVSLMRTQSLRRFVGEAGGASALLHYGPKVTKEMRVRLEFGQGAGAHAYEARLGYAAGDTLLFLDETNAYHRPGDAEPRVLSLGAGHHESNLEPEIPTNASHEITSNTQKSLRGLSFFHFHDTSAQSVLRQNGNQHDNVGLRSDGSNLAPFLWRLSSSDAPHARAAWKRIGMLVQQVAPYIKRLEPDLIDASNPQTSAVRLYWLDERDHRFDVSDLSDGTLRAIALIAALSQPVFTLPRFISIDEPELGLHPAALALLASLVQSASAHCQVLLATQSPALLDEFEADQVVVVERQGGATSFRRLDTGSLAEWLEAYSLSELFDKNVLGGRP